MSDQFSISQSKASSWLSCRLKYHLSSIEHLRPRIPPKPLKFGEITHSMIEAQAQKKDMFKVLDQVAVRDEKLFREQEEEYGTIISDIGYIMRAYQRFWKLEPLRFQKIKGKVCEIPFEVELTRDIVAKGRLDGVVVAKNQQWLLENKTHKEFKNDDHRWRNLQSVVYIRIMQLMGHNPAGMLWNYIRSKSPTKPKLLKAGGLSRDAKLDTLPEVVEDAIEEYGLKREAHLDLIEAQEERLSTWFERVYTPVQDEVVKKLFAEFIAVAREIRDYYRKTAKAPPRTIGMHCQWCMYEPICRADLQGLDVDFVKKHQFTVDSKPFREAA